MTGPAEQPDEQFSLLAAGEDPPPDLDADEEDLLDLEDLDLDQGAALELDEAGEQAPPRTGRSWAFDFASGRFIARPGAGPVATRDDATLRTWIEKCLRTAREAHPIHVGTGYGLEAALDVGGTPDDVAGLEGRVREALTVHPRIADVREFSLEPDPDDDEAALVGFRVVLDEGGTELELQGVPVRGEAG